MFFRYFNHPLSLVFFSLLGILIGLSPFPMILELADIIAQLFINILKLLSLPILFLSVILTITLFASENNFKAWGTTVVIGTVTTTFLASSIGLIFYHLFNPVRHGLLLPDLIDPALFTEKNYLHYVKQLIPDNIIRPFYEGNVISVMLLAIIVGQAIIRYEKKSQSVTIISHFLQEIFSIFKIIIQQVMLLLPLMVCVFLALFVKDMTHIEQATPLLYYIAAIIGGNLFQALIILPLYLLYHGIKPYALFKAMLPSLSIAFFTKSSIATLPSALKCAEERAFIPKKMAQFVFPLCTTINMNGCAAFIVVTSLFVMESNGAMLTVADKILWVLISVIAAIGNAGIPMGCFFLTCSLMSAMQFPLHLMMVILPFYTLIDMVETAVNMWSDSCIAKVTSKKHPPPSIEL